VDAAQIEQPVDPESTTERQPAAHDWQRVAAANDASSSARPVGVAAGCRRYCLAGHEMQTVAPATALYVPLLQTLQDDEPTCGSEPAGHSSSERFVMPDTGAYVPGGAGVHAVSVGATW